MSEFEKKPRRRSDDLVPSPVPPSITEKTIATSAELRKQLNVLIILTVFLYFGFGLLIWWTWDQSNTDTKALCAISREAQKRVAEGEAYLKSHSNGALGLTPAQIQQSINNSIGTVNALKVVSC